MTPRPAGQADRCEKLNLPCPDSFFKAPLLALEMCVLAPALARPRHNRGQDTHAQIRPPLAP
jgi:hypothetical protein